jgi:hypothetical protein
MKITATTYILFLNVSICDTTLLVQCQAEKCLCSKVADENQHKIYVWSKNWTIFKIKKLSYKKTYGYKVIPVWFQQNFTAREN